MLEAGSPSALSGATREIFRAGGRSYRWPDVLAAAFFRDDAAALYAEVAEALAVARYAGEEGFKLSDDAGAAGEAFRVAHSLITGEEMERWLDHCGILLEEFDVHFASRALAERFKEKIGEIRLEYAPASDEVVAAMWVATILSGSFEAFAFPFARRVAARFGPRPPADGGAVERALSEGETRVPEMLRTPGLLEDLAAMEVRHAAAEHEAASPERCAEELRARAYQLTRIVVAETVFRSRDQANEAYQGVATDGVGFEEVALRAGVEPTERSFFVDEAPEAATPLLSTLPGRALEPEAVEGGFRLTVLKRRVEPDLADPAVATRVRERLIAAHFDVLVGQNISWSFDPWTVP